jgi:hypothetical protein
MPADGPSVTNATLSAARRMAGELLGHDPDLVWDREWLETSDAWAIIVDTGRYYMTALDRHRLSPPQFVMVPKDGSAPHVTSAMEGSPIGGFTVGAEPKPRVSDAVLYRSQRREFWQAWLPRLRYFELRVVPPRYDGGDQLVARFRFDDEVDAATRLTAIGLAPQRTERGIHFEPNTLEAAPRFRGLTLGGIPTHVTLTDRRAWVPSYPFVSFSVAVAGADGDMYRVTRADVENALALEQRFDELGWASLRDPDEPPLPFVTRARYPELFVTGES